jgi:hypothetical protein
MDALPDCPDWDRSGQNDNLSLLPARLVARGCGGCHTGSIPRRARNPLPRPETGGPRSSSGTSAAPLDRSPKNCELALASETSATIPGTAIVRMDRDA